MTGQAGEPAGSRGGDPCACGDPAPGRAAALTGGPHAQHTPASSLFSRNTFASLS